MCSLQPWRVRVYVLDANLEGDVVESRLQAVPSGLEKSPYSS